MKPIKPVESSAWAAEWRSENKIWGPRRHFIHRGAVVALFRTREEARDYIKERFGYIAKRKDLREEPHGWRMPVPVRVKIIKQ